MDSGACKDLCDESNDSCARSSEKLDESIVTGEVREDVPKLPEATDCTASLGPITPDADKENGDFPIDFQSPLTVMRKPHKLSGIDSNCDENGCEVSFVENDSPQTPKDGVFDPFAPGPDNVAWAPQCKKYLQDLRISVARRLDFNISFETVQSEHPGYDAESLSDQEIFESVYENLLEVIVSKQTEGVLADITNLEYDSDECKTPPSAVRLSGIADTCPGAPVKHENEPRIIHVGLCRKLEF